MIRLEPGCLYRSNCGAVLVYLELRLGFHRIKQLSYEEDCEYCEEDGPGHETWAYADSPLGLWSGEENDKSFHLHLKEEILP